MFCDSLPFSPFSHNGFPRALVFVQERLVGMTQEKAERYGGPFLRVIEEFSRQHSVPTAVQPNYAGMPTPRKALTSGVHGAYNMWASQNMTVVC